jgi:conjugative relaxase-like TrwC/TraI family protein
VLSVVDLDPGRAGYYLARSKLEYFQGENAQGLWFGRGCIAKGLSGTVEAREFRSLFHGFLHGKKLVQSAGKDNHHAGEDLCFSAPKSVSSLWAVSDKETRAKIEAAQLRAVQAALKYLEEKATRVRIGKGGTERVAAGMVAAIWMHGSSRAEEPDLHHHASLFNVGVTPDGKTRTTCGELYFMHKMAAGAVYRAELARLLERNLKVTTYRPTEKTFMKEEKKNWFEIRGVPKEQMDRWSTRSKQIAEEAWSKGLEGAEGKQIATLATRDAKTGTPMRELFGRWHREGVKHGFTQQSVPTGQVPKRDTSQELREAVTIALQNVTRSNSHFAERDLVREIALEAQGRGLGHAQVMEAVADALEKNPEVVRLGTVKHESRFTTRETLEVEARLLSLVEATKGKNRHQVSDKAVLKAIRETEAEETKKRGREVKLTDEQLEAVNRFTKGTDQIAVMTGDAGTGKSLTCAAARRALEMEGYRCLGLALARKAASGLEQGAGIKSTSIAKALMDLDVGILDQAKHHLKQLGQAFARSVYEDVKDTPIVGKLLPDSWKKKPYSLKRIEVDDKTVVFIDEAAMVGVRQMEELVRKILERGAKICLLGDSKQLSPIEAGQCFTAISGILGEARLTKIIRQREEVDKLAVQALSRGDAKEALNSYAERGFVHVGDSRKEAIWQMVSDWSKEGVRNGKDNLLVCATNLERSQINQLAQAAMRVAGKLGKKSVRISGANLHSGDRIAFTQNSTFYGVNNGDTGRVISVGTKKITRKTFHGKQFRSLWSMLKYAEKVKSDKTVYVTVELDKGKTVSIPLDKYGKENLRLGYCLNTVQAQGMTAENAFLLTGGTMTSRELIYVQASRSRQAPRVYTDCHSAGDGLKQLAQQASKSRAKDMAHDHLEPKDEPRLEITR